MGQQRPPGAQQRPGQGFGPQRPGFGQQQGAQPVQMDPMQIAEEIALAVGRLQQVLKMARPGQEDQTGAAKKMLRIAHTKRLSGDHEAAVRHLQNAHRMMDGVETKIAPLPRPLTYRDQAKRREREQQQAMNKQTQNQIKQKQAVQKATAQKPAFGRM